MIEFISDKTRTWVNNEHKCIGRFNIRAGYEVAGPALDMFPTPIRKAGPLDIDDWAAWKSHMFTVWLIIVDDQYKPTDLPPF